MRIAFCGPIGAGKTTAACYLSETYGVPIYSFGAAVREVAALRHSQPERSIGGLFAWVQQNLPDWPEAKQEDLVWRWLDAFFRLPLGDPPGKPRRLLIAVGQTGRAVDPRLWIDLLLRRVGEGEAIVDDLRFLNEAEALRRAKFTIVRIDAPAAARAERVRARDGEYPAWADRDESEAEWPRIEPAFRITNDGNLQSFRRRVEEVVIRAYGGLAFYAGRELGH